jgi:hypothetical protein
MCAKTVLRQVIPIVFRAHRQRLLGSWSSKWIGFWLLIWHTDGLDTHQRAILCLDQGPCNRKYVRQNPNARLLSDCKPYSVIILIKSLWSQGLMTAQTPSKIEFPICAYLCPTNRLSQSHATLVLFVAYRCCMPLRQTVCRTWKRHGKRTI